MSFYRGGSDYPHVIEARILEVALSEEIGTPEVADSRAKARITEYVNSQSYWDELKKTILAVSNEAQRAKLMLDLLDYVTPKLKTVDPPLEGGGRAVVITYVQDDTKKEA